MQSEGYSFAIDGVVMRVVILGSGVVGVTSWYLSQGGHDVTVIDREFALKQETNAANTGQISPGYEVTWAVPSVYR